MKRILCVILVILSFLTSTAYAINEPRHAPNMYINWASNQSFDAVDVDWLCDQDATNTYWAVHNWSNGYAGFQNKDGKHVLLLSLWDLPDGTSPQIEYVSDGKNGGFGGEGTGKQVFTNYNWQVGKWYSMRVQIDKIDNKVIYSQWIKEENGDWLKTAAISYPNHEFRFNGVSMFQEDFTFNNEMRSCKMRNARGKVYGSDNWEFLSRCEITNSFFPTDEATWENGVLENITYNCDWDANDEYVWVQSGGQGFADNGKTIPASYTLSETNNTDINESNTPIEENPIGENNETEVEDKDTTVDNKDNRNWFQKFIDGIVKWIQSLLGIDTNDNSKIEVIDFSKNMGSWYYTPYTDYEEDDIKQITFKETKNNKATITWADNSTEQITFISENTAEGPLFLALDSKENLRQVKPIYIFSVSNEGKEMFERALRYADNNDVVGESAYGYRSAEDFFFDDITMYAPGLLSSYIGKTVSDVRNSFGNGFSFEGYQGTSIMPYYDKGITFFLEKYSSNPSNSDKIIAVTSNNETKVFEKLSGKMSYSEIVNVIGAEITLSQPKKYFSQIDNREEYILQFDYKGYAVDFTWLHDPNTNKSTYVYVSKK